MGGRPGFNKEGRITATERLRVVGVMVDIEKRVRSRVFVGEIDEEGWNWGGEVMWVWGRVSSKEVRKSLIYKEKRKWSTHYLIKPLTDRERVSIQLYQWTPPQKAIKNYWARGYQLVPTNDLFALRQRAFNARYAPNETAFHLMKKFRSDHLDVQ